MFFVYSIVLTLAFVVMLPRLLFDAIFNGKYAAGFFQRLGFLPKFERNEHAVVWVHCVSVGETNAAKPLIDKIIAEFPTHRMIISNTTRTGHRLARELFADKAEAIFYFPFDWRFSVRRALRHFSPSAVLLMETEIWFNFVREANKSGVHVAIVNGRLSARSYKRYAYLKNFMRRVLSYPELALMQANPDAKRLMALGMRANKVKVTGNIKFDQATEDTNQLTVEFRTRWNITADEPLIVAASTHPPEEKWLLEALKTVWKGSERALPRLLIAPRHPERFQAVADEIGKYGFAWSRRSEAASGRDEAAEVILLDSIGELRAVFPLAELVFVGGSLIPHGGQSILEPAAAGRAIITGPFTSNFEAAVNEFLEHDALVQLPRTGKASMAKTLAAEFSRLLDDADRRQQLGVNAAAVMERNRGAVDKTVDHLESLLRVETTQ